MKRFNPALAAILFILLIAPLSGATASAKDTWTSVRSKNFMLVGNASEKEIRQVATRLEQFRDVFTKLFSKVKFNSPVPTTVIVFKSDSSYRPFKPNPNIAGYFQPGPDVNYITLTTEDHNGDPFNVIFHEYTHLLLDNTLGRNVPLWFNEGLAEYYSTFKMENDDRKAILGNLISNHIYSLREQKLLPFRTLFAVDHRSPYYNEKEKQNVFYAESWALIHYLIQGNKGQRRPQLGRFLDLLASNVAVEQAFQQAFQTDYETIEKELKNYIGHNSYTATYAEFKQKLEFDAEMQSAPMTEAEAQAYLGDLLLHSNRQDAETYLQKALELDPNQPMAQASMGMLRVRQGRIDDAKKYLEQAVAANTKNHLAHYYYAFALSREGMGATNIVGDYRSERLQTMRSELKKAIELKPDFPESYNLLAFVNMVADEQLDESIELLKRAQTLSPGRQDFSFMLAQIYMHKDDYKTARALLERITQSTGAEAGLQQNARTLLNEIASMEEAEARYKAETQRADADVKTDTNANPDRSAKAVDSAPPTPRLRRRNSTGTNAEGEPSNGIDPMSYLEEALRKPNEGEQRLQGLLMRLDCDSKGIVFFIKVGDRLLKLHIDSFENMDITSYAPDVGGEITCGARNPENNVIATFTASKDARAKVDGEIVAIEFVPKDFKLKKQ